ncbi:pseudouridine kinase [Escherichia coli]|uniref:pseudouridine kinase n=1 Tax=Escherichia coli TaxID=562 RepID=UPI00090050C3|nr:pseudouridine kinase [Escherichia coli]EEC9535287.1 pseudouridine kinase [Escherichia coli]EED0760456.1 pseudouridine kinase [Escherichia coli]EEQ5353504.1 pseudouridine kinase [Escherichia coli]EEQ5363522.1 pseudouridine kinase [Escherichia coli]EEQ8835416.1 pseudouridine kinase [Escherichia coli]
MREKDYVVIIGSANIDVAGYSHESLNYADSNPGKIKFTPGGVGRNIAQNLALLGNKAWLLSAVGSDFYGQSLLTQTNQSGVYVDKCLIVPGENTSSYLSLLYNTGEMLVAINDMNISNAITAEYLAQHREFIQRAKVIVADCNISEEALAWILDNAANVPVFVDPVSAWKCVKVRDRLNQIHTLKPNRLEAETLSGIALSGRDDVAKVAAWFHQHGLNRLVLSMGGDGVYYSDISGENGWSAPIKTNVIYVTGAGDATMAGLASCWVDGMPFAESVRFAQGCSSMALACEYTNNPELLQISAEVQDALKNKKPVVALESTIISHGMPFPQNAQTAIEVEETIRKQGAVPATIAIIGGVMKVGLSKEEIELLGREGHNVTKVSRRDLPFVVAAGKNGATTVASTMIIAALAGIKVFATGGIGGVHRGAEHTFDISADLQELANTNVTVVCAGAKSILDLGLTTEYLETFGVPLIGYQTKALPAFFCRTSPFEVSIRLDSATEIARAMAVKWQTGLNGGLVVANPIPEQFAMPEESINAAIDQAVAEAEEQGVIGKESTPFLLARVAELTGGDSLKSNIQLVFNNAILASEIAKEYQRLAG